MSKKAAKKEAPSYTTSVVKHLPSIERKSKYDETFEKVPDDGLLALTFEEVNQARNLRSSLRGYLKSRELTNEYNVDRRGNVVYISKSSYTAVYPDPTADEVKEDETE